MPAFRGDDEICRLLSTKDPLELLREIKVRSFGTNIGAPPPFNPVVEAAAAAAAAAAATTTGESHGESGSLAVGEICSILEKILGGLFISSSRIL